MSSTVHPVTTSSSEVETLAQTPADVQIEMVWVQQVMLIHEIGLARENICERNAYAGSPHSSSLQSFKRHSRSMNNAPV